MSKIYKTYGYRLWFYKSFTNKFELKTNTYNYFYHKYNTTWLTERAVEIPIIWEIINRFKSKNILEVGNVLSHYFFIEHDIVDKYEIYNKVINQDIVDFQPSKMYDLIISISTLEHVGWNEIPNDPEKVLYAIRNLKKIVTQDGLIVLTLPLGWNPHLDQLFNENKIIFFNRICLKRINKNNRWKEVEWKEIQNSKFNYPFPSANGLLILFLRKE